MANEPSAYDLIRQLDRIEKRLDKIETRLEERYVPIGPYNDAIRRLDERVDELRESQVWMRRSIVMAIMGVTGQFLILVLAAALR